MINFSELTKEVNTAYTFEQRRRAITNPEEVALIWTNHISSTFETIFENHVMMQPYAYLKGTHLFTFYSTLDMTPDEFMRFSNCHHREYYYGMRDENGCPLPTITVEGKGAVEMAIREMLTEHGFPTETTVSVTPFTVSSIMDPKFTYTVEGDTSPSLLSGVVTIMVRL